MDALSGFVCTGDVGGFLNRDFFFHAVFGIFFSLPRWLGEKPSRLFFLFLYA